MSTKPQGQLSVEERRQAILNLLDRKGRVTVQEIKSRFSTSAVTARSDLDALSSTGALVRCHGGGIRQLTEGPDHPLRVRLSLRFASDFADLFEVRGDKRARRGESFA